MILIGPTEPPTSTADTQQLKQTAFKKNSGIFGAILSLLLLFVVIIKRQEFALKKTPNEHKEFATSLMDMLDSHAERVKAPPTPMIEIS